MKQFNWSMFGTVMFLSLSSLSGADAQKLPDNYNIIVTPQELDTIGNGLGSMPFKDAAPLINKLREQVMQQAPKPVEKKPDEEKK